MNTLIHWLWTDLALLIGRFWLVALVLLAAAIAVGVAHDTTRKRRELQLTDEQRLRLIHREGSDA